MRRKPIQIENCFICTLCESNAEFIGPEPKILSFCDSGCQIKLKKYPEKKNAFKKNFIPRGGYIIIANIACHKTPLILFIFIVF